MLKESKRTPTESSFIMETFVAFLIWIAFATGFAAVARFYVVKWAERRGWTALTMPMAYHIWLILLYLVVVQLAWVLLYVTIIT